MAASGVAEPRLRAFGGRAAGAESRGWAPPAPPGDRLAPRLSGVLGVRLGGAGSSEHPSDAAPAEKDRGAGAGAAGMGRGGGRGAAARGRARPSGAAGRSRCPVAATPRPGPARPGTPGPAAPHPRPGTAFSPPRC